MMKAASITREEAAAMLQSSPEMLKRFEEAYARFDAARDISGNLFAVNAKQMARLITPAGLPDAALTARIVRELLSCTEVLCWDGRELSVERFPEPGEPFLVKEDLAGIPLESRPQITGDLCRRDMGEEPSYLALLTMYKGWKEATDPQKKKFFYGHFRQGLDILDLDWVTWEMLGINPNAMGCWLPAVAPAAVESDSFRVPATRVAKVPMTLLQLTRMEYSDLNKVTLDIVDQWAKQAFQLKADGDYFVKTGTYSSKFDFRNAHVSDPAEIGELGQYLLFIHWQANCMAHYDLSGRNQPSTYGVSTTNEWVVRDFIPSKSTASIYHGLPLRTEYRLFADMDTRQVIGCHPYWDPQVMKRRFEGMADAADPDMVHDSLCYRAAEASLMSEYERNIPMVRDRLQAMLPHVSGLSGQWSVDIMQEGGDFWLIDMARAENSAYYDCVSPALRNPSPENWLPNLGR